MSVDFHWQVQQVKQRLSEVLRAAETAGPQFVTRHGRDVAVVMSIEDFRRCGDEPPRSFAEHVMGFPKVALTDDEHDAVFARDDSPDQRAIPFVGPDWE